MHEMMLVDLRTLLRQYKDDIPISPDKTYRLVTISKRGTISFREEKKGIDIKTDKVYRVKSGSFIYSRLAAHTGAFGLVPPELDGAVVTNEMPVFEINEDIIHPSYLIHLLGQDNFLKKLYQLTQGMGRVRIKEDAFLQLRVSMHRALSDQKLIVQKIDTMFVHINNLSDKQQEQLNYLKNLQQTALQDAMKGKLTVEWRARNAELIRDKNSAVKMLEAMKAKRDQFVKEGKIKKSKLLPPIALEEMPFELPKEWVWCRLGDIGNAETHPFVDGPFGSAINTKHDYINEGIPVLRMLNVKPFKFISDNLKYVSEKKFESLKRHNVKSKDILFSKVGAGIGEACVVPDDFRVGMLSTTGITRLRVGEIVSPEYLCYFLNVNRKNFMGLSSNTAQPFLNMGMINMFKFPLPSLPEQNEIVGRLEKLMAMIKGLENQIDERNETLDILIQAVLREAFSVESPVE